MEAIPRGREARSTLLSDNSKAKHQPLPGDPLIVSLNFDDGSSDHYAMRSILAEHSMPATFFINSSAVGMPGYLNWAQLAELAADGNEVGGHTVDHVRLTTLSASAARSQIANDRQALMSHGFAVTSFAYPYGDFNTNVEAIVQECGYSAARRAWGLSPIDRTCPNRHKWYPDVAEEIPPVNRYAIRTIGLGAGNTVAELKNLVTRAERNGGGWVTLVFHHVGSSDDAANGYFVSLVVLRAFLEWLERRAARGTYVLTVRDALAEVGGRPSGALLAERSVPLRQERAVGS
jgi:peptidoglycan/xylan/chitin deacetylase (PgdA/CDA1 family)